MSIRWIRGGVILFFLAFVASVTWPGMIPGNRIFPLVLGLPFSMVWIASWVVLSFVVLAFLDAMEERARGANSTTRPTDREGGARTGKPTSGREG